MLKSENFGNGLFENDVYKYEGVELIPSIFADILVLLVDGTSFKREVAVNKVVSFHKEHGGFASKPNYIYAFKHVAKGCLEPFLTNIGYGTWRLSYRSDDVGSVCSDDASVTPVFCEPDVSDALPNELSADKEVGDGRGAVYVYYYDIYKMFAEQGGKLYWECKVGMTDGDAMSRVLSQAKTAYPELPHIALVIKSDTPRELESALHLVLKLRGRHIENAPGKEWFLTTPEEVENLWRGFVG